jgi:hypothetical protein
MMEADMRRFLFVTVVAVVLAAGAALAAEPDRAKAPVPKGFAEALTTSADTKVVAWVAGQVNLWPREMAEPALKAGLEAQKAKNAAEAFKSVEAALTGQLPGKEGGKP